MDAQAQLHCALALHTDVLGAEHPEAATKFNHIELILHDIGDPDGAPSHSNGRWRSMRPLGQDHPNIGRDANNLARC
jgi:hypothetical protein